jgi:phosphoglycolate phosphatase
LRTMAVRVIVFDYDGTLVYSNEIKRSAYRPLFPEGKGYDSYVQAALAANPSGSRFDVIRSVLLCAEDYKQEDQVEKKVQYLAQEYDRVATEGAATCEERPGVGDELAMLSEKYPLYVLSATLESSMQKIIKRRGWDNYFKSVLGFPRKKSEELKAIAYREGISVDSVLMVGDSEVDRDAALKAGSHFLFLSHETPIAAVQRYINEIDNVQR